MDLQEGVEERGCVFTVKKTKIYVHTQLKRDSSSTRVVNTRPLDLSNKCMTKDFLRDFHHGYTGFGGQEDHVCV